MCNLSKGVEERGISKGITIGRTEGITIGRVQALIECIKILMEKERCTAEEAMDILHISDEERNACLGKMERLALKS